MRKRTTWVSDRTQTILREGRYVKKTKRGNKLYEWNGYYWCIMGEAYAWGSTMHFNDRTI